MGWTPWGMAGDVSAQLVALFKQVTLGWGWGQWEAVSTQPLVNSRKYEDKLYLNKSHGYRALK